MGLVNSSNVNASIGQSFQNTFCNVVFNTSKMLVTGQVFCSLNWYKSQEDFNAGADKIYLLDSNGNKVEDAVIDIAINDVIKESGQSHMSDVVAFFFTKTAAKLTADYGWSLSITE